MEDEVVVTGAEEMNLEVTEEDSEEVPLPLAEVEVEIVEVEVGTVVGSVVVLLPEVGETGAVEAEVTEAAAGAVIEEAAVVVEISEEGGEVGIDRNTQN